MNLAVLLLLLVNLFWTLYLTYLFVRKKGNTASVSTSETAANFTKIHLVRFNPFEELGGDQSFILVLLDSHLSGVIITSLHAKEATRVYAKPVKNGQAQDVVLSKEEKVALAKAIKN
ncbi:DUF4446 family protein [Patescibacteria group bacterium]|nr:DUF4446 family protein [Patescibacteria group bacterium]